MWLNGTIRVSRRTLFDLKKVKVNASWHKKKSNYDNDLPVNPLAFAYAATRTSIVGTHIGLRGSIAGAGLSIAATAYLRRSGMNLKFHPRFNYVKDFIGTGIKGTVGAAFSYLYMMNKGYRWSGHWEDVVSKPSSGPHPDFVFASDTNVCIVDAKGTASSYLDVEQLVKKEWKRQIWPHRKTPLSFGGHCDQGSVIATVVAPSVNASFTKAHGYFGTPNPPASTPLAIKSVQRANYINACFLLGLTATAKAMLLPERADIPPVLQLERELEIFHRIEDGLIIGPPRVLLSYEGKNYLMRAYAHANVLKSVVENLYGEHNIEDLQSPELILNPRAVDDSRSYIIQTKDGIGARFTPID